MHSHPHAKPPEQIYDSLNTIDECGSRHRTTRAADPIWMYQKMDATNDGLMNAYKWRLDNKPNIVNLPGMVDIFDRTLAKHRKTTFIACHFMNLDYDLARLGEMFDRNPNLYAD